MNKKEAKRLSTSGTISIGELRSMIDASRGRGGSSKLNKAIDLETALDVYRAAIADRDDASKPVGLVPDIYSGNPAAMKPSRDSLLIYNILVDCA